MNRYFVILSMAVGATSALMALALIFVYDGLMP